MTATSFIRAALYALLFAGAAALLGMTAYHVHFTESLGGIGFYVPIVVELLATSCLAVIISLWFFIAIIGRLGGGHNSYASEAVMLGIIWLMYLVGASIITHRWPNLLWCLGSQRVCRILDAIVAFAWINWVFTTILLLGSFGDMQSKGRGPTEPAHGRSSPTFQTTTQTANTPVMTTIA